MEITVEIRTGDGAWTGLVRRSDEPFTRSLDAPRLGPVEAIPLKGGARTLGNLVRVLVDYETDDLAQAFDERGQLEIGSWLYRQLSSRSHAEAGECRAGVPASGRPTGRRSVGARGQRARPGLPRAARAAGETAG
ncbi:hypothetical protein [Candidatus Thiodictyon syntrophicum]|jgi:hypothetical protein|uniref:Uncharacterized protein n=1 Tax=Candidatus Thiodictyon syntrophicum TaxID=1166950 RepID=A0A2K8UB06_9GAMM|nr:hypothetical protein [Candidatus Thiodictyon syntrophicum]AUB82756.1 hypothetical protein THSYN_18635 [Candidatus Thiodictyon syntrophicum]